MKQQPNWPAISSSLHLAKQMLDSQLEKHQINRQYYLEELIKLNHETIVEIVDSILEERGE